MAGYETKIRLHIKPHIGGMKLCEVTDDTLDDLYRMLETAPCPANKGKPLGAKSVRHVHNILSGALGSAVPKLIPANPAATATPRQAGRSGRRNATSRPWTTTGPAASCARCGSRAATRSVTAA